MSFVLFLCHVTLKLAVSRSQPAVPYGAKFFCLISLFSTFNVKYYVLSGINPMQSANTLNSDADVDFVAF